MARPLARVSRRRFLQTSAVIGSGYFVSGLPSRAQSDSPNEKLNLAIIGAGGQGAGNLGNVSSENIVALCDPDQDRARDAFNTYSQAAKYADYRKLFDEMHQQIDAVVVSTPDHNHAPASAMAMRLGLHVYCEKPLTHSVYEARVLRELAASTGVATQMGNHGTAGSGLREGVEVVQSGAIGHVREVHVWTNRPIWPQGIGRPTETPPVPSTLDWDVWLGPAPLRPYHPAYVPFAWRGWWDFGTGALGDMACHTANLPFMALKLGYPSSVECLSTREPVNAETGPTGAAIRYEFPEREGLPALTLTWYEGGGEYLPPGDLLPGVQLPTSGSLMVGDKGKLFSPDDYGGSYVLLPESDFEGYQPPTPTLPRSPGHHREWLDACRGGPAAMSNFSYAGLLTEALVLGNVAVRVGQRIEWDGPNLTATNCPDAAQYIRREYRSGWSI